MSAIRPRFRLDFRREESVPAAGFRGGGMDDDKRALLRRLFAVATEIAESAHDAAIKGQSARLTAQDYADAARRLQATARNVAVLAEAATVIAEHSATSPDPAP